MNGAAAGRVMAVWGGVAAAVAFALLGAGAQAASPGKSAAALPPPAVPLTLENARPLAVPPRPGLQAPAAPAAPVRFSLPVVAVAPPPPAIAAVRDTAPAPLPITTPELPASLKGVPAMPAAEPVPAPVPVAAPPPAAAPAPEPPPAQVAALPPPTVPERIVAPPLPEGPLTVEFAADSLRVPTSAESLLAILAVHLQAEPNLRIQLRSYAHTTDDPREARKASLDRALAVRERLVAAGIRSTRVDVRPLGASGPDAAAGPADRIDIDILNK